MRVRLIAVGTRMPAWVEAGFAEYAQRLPRELRLELVEIPVEARGKNADIARLREAEGEKMLRAAGNSRIVAFDERGETLDTLGWSKAVPQWLQDGRDVALLVGGPDGLAPACLAAAASRCARACSMRAVAVWMSRFWASASCTRRSSSASPNWLHQSPLPAAGSAAA